MLKCCFYALLITSKSYIINSKADAVERACIIPKPHKNNFKFFEGKISVPLFALR